MRKPELDMINRPNAEKRIGLFGGSFDPPHLGHIALVQAGLDMGLDEVWVIPALPVHRTLSGHADGAMRMVWLERVFENNAKVKVVDWEVRQRESTPMIDTLRRFKSAYPTMVPWLMLGADAWAGLESWREYPAHQVLCNVAVFARQHHKSSAAGIPLAGWQQIDLESWSACNVAGHWCDVQVRLPDVSATMIRDHVDLGLSLTDLVPKVLQSEINKQYMKKKQCE